MENITTAFNQWKTRPADQRFWNVPEMATFVRSDREASHEKRDSNLGSFRAIVHPASNEGLLLCGPNGGAVEMTNYAFGQVAGVVSAPASYLRSLPAELAAQNLNYGFQANTGAMVNALVRKGENGRNTLRAVTSNQYGRIWNEEVVRVAESLVSRGWRVPPARPAGIRNERTRRATAADVLRNASHPTLGIREGALIAPAGLYASDRDSFIFLIDEQHPIITPDRPERPFYRGVILWNSEVGAKTCGLTMFLFDSVCGNHIIWDAKVYADVRLRHTKHAGSRWQNALYSLRRAVESSTGSEVRMIEAARTTLIADTREKVIELTYRKADGAFTLAEARESYDEAVRHRDTHGDPNTVWGFSSGMTWYSQSLPHTSDRERLDRAAGAMIGKVGG